MSPAEQQQLADQNQIATGKDTIAQSLLNTTGQQLTAAQPGAPAQTTRETGAGNGLQTNLAAEDPAAENAVWDQYKNMQLPLQQQQTESEQSQLADQGLKVGDAAYDTAMKNLNNTQYTQDQTAEDQAVTAGQGEAATQFAADNNAQEAAYGQNSAQTAYNNEQIPQNISNEEASLGLGQEQSGYDLNLMNAALNGTQVGMPSFPGSTSASSGTAANLLGAGEDQAQSALDAYNAQVGQGNAETGAVGGVLAAALAAAA